MAKAVAARSRRSFLVAATTARLLAGRSEPIARDELDRLPVDVGEAFELDLKRFGSEWRQGLTVLGALAFARGRGLPRSLWPLVASALDSGVSTKDIGHWEDAAGFYVSREQVEGEEVCRLYHDEFVRHLQRKLDGALAVCRNPDCSHASRTACVAMALLAHVQRDALAEPVSRHVLEHLAGYLGDANLRELLVRLVTASWWIDKKRRGNQDPVRLLNDFSKAIEIVRRDLSTMIAKNHVYLKLDPTPDEKNFNKLHESLAAGRVDDAEALLTGIRSRRLRARGRSPPRSDIRSRNVHWTGCWTALDEASGGGIGELKYILDQSRDVLTRASPGTDFSVLDAEFRGALVQSSTAETALGGVPGWGPY